MKPVPKTKSLRKVLVGGCFDLIHYGHITFLKEAKAAGDYLIIALEPDETILRKNRPMAHNQNKRQEILLSLRCVDHVICLPVFQTFEDYLALVKTIKPQVIAITAGDPYRREKQQQAEQVGAEVKIVTPHLPDYSSSYFFQSLC